LLGVAAAAAAAAECDVDPVADPGILKHNFYAPPLIDGGLSDAFV